MIRSQLQRRKPGQSDVSTSRKEEDNVEILSGILGDTTTGHPIAMIIQNADAKPSDYASLKDVYRPGHADYTYFAKYGVRDYRGGGRSSARITAGWVAAGALCDQWLSHMGIKIVGFTKSIHQLEAQIPEQLNRSDVDRNIVRCPDDEAAERMIALIRKVKDEKDSVGGVIGCRITGCPAGLGDPVFQKLNASLASAMFSINAVKGVEFGDGFDTTRKLGSDANDLFDSTGGGIVTTTNHSGGIQGGISNGQQIEFQVAFKPTSTIGKEQATVDKEGKSVQLKAAGRHDPCVLPRAVPIVESMAALVIADHLLMQRTSTI